MATKKQPEPVHPDNPSRLRLTINNATLSGVTVAGFWVWECPEYSDLIELHSGLDDATAMVEAFVKRALRE